MNLSSRVRPKTLDVIIYPGFKAIEAVAIVHIFESANSRLALDDHSPVYDIKLASSVAGPVKSHTLIALEASKQLSALAPPDIAIIVGAPDIELALGHSSDVVEWCRNTSTRVSRMVGLCSGSFFLAEAGLLANRRAATHWSVASLMSKRYPDVRVEPDAIFVRDDGIWTSAGVTAGIDLALAMIEEDLGRKVALAIARDLVVYLKRPGGQSQFSMHLSSQMTEHAPIRQVQEWILREPQRELDIGELAGRASMSERNFARVFVRETGYGPAEYVEIARIELARVLLEQGNIPLKAVAAKCGFRSGDHLRRAFHRRCGVTPGAYRDRFSGTGVMAGTSTLGAVNA